MTQRKSQRDNASRGLVLEDISIQLGARVLIETSTMIAPGETLTVMGPSGVGKSTLLAFVGGFLDPVFKAKGRVLLDGCDITLAPTHERHIGLLFQDALLFPHLSVGDNLTLGIPAHIKKRKQRADLAKAALSEFGMDGFFERDPATLSGGQKARVALARTLLSEPKALLLDEPFSKLDVSLRGQIRDLVFDMAKARQLPVLLVTHDPSDAEAASGAMITLDA